MKLRKKIDETKPLIYCDLDDSDQTSDEDICADGGDCQHMVRNYTVEEDTNE